MSESTSSPTPAGAGVGEERPGLIDAVPVRHPGRWVAVAVIALLVAMTVNLMLTNDAFNWPFVWKAMVQTLSRGYCTSSALRKASPLDEKSVSETCLTP